MNQEKEVTDSTSSSSLLAPNFPNDYVASAVTQLAASVSTLNNRLKDLEDNFHMRFQIFGESIAREKISLENIHSRLDILDYLSVQVKDLEKKLEKESSEIRNVLAVSNEDVKHLPGQLKEFEDTVTKSPNRELNVQNKNNAHTGKLSEKRETHRNNSFENDDVGAIVLQKVESVLPRILAAELNHFYLNMATKTDYSMGQLQTEIVTRLRRIETVTKKTVSEIQDGRQDMSHITHLQRTLIDKLPIENEHSEKKCEKLFNGSHFEEIFHQMEERIVLKITSSMKKENFTQLHLHEKDSKGNTDDSKQYLASDLWRGMFSTGLTRSPISHTTNAVASSKLCLDPATFATLEEVKQLLKTLMSKGEDLRRTLTEQAKEGVDLLKLLHQRFSVLLRRINTDPKHAEALLAEVQELEHLVENSYSSILLAQNLFIDACRRDQKQQPSIEGQIVDVLNKLVTNIDLGHQYNRKQLQEVRLLIEQMNSEEQTKNITFSPSWISQNGSKYSNVSHKGLSSFNTKIYNKLLLSVSEANSTEEKFQNVLERINSIELKLQSLNKNPGNVKNIIDELLTGAKDLKGYSRDQIVLLQSFQDEILKFVNISVSNNFNAKFNAKEQMKVSNTSFILSNACVSSVIKILNSSLSDPELYAAISEKNITRIVKEILSKSTIVTKDVHKSESFKFQDDEMDSNDTIYYDIDKKDMFLDDDHNWFKVRVYGNEDLFSDVTDGEKLPENLRSKRRFSGKISANNEMTVLENEFNED